MRTVSKVTVAVLAALMLAGAGRAQAADTAGARAEVSFTYQSQGGFASNQFAVWVEDANGILVKTLYATAFTAKGGWKTREQALPEWVAKSRLPSMRQSEIDAITSATPASGVVTKVWDLRDGSGELVAPGEYVVAVEGSLRGDSRVVYRAPVTVFGQERTVDAVPEYFGPDVASERGMLSGVKVHYIP